MNISCFNLIIYFKYLAGVLHRHSTYPCNLVNSLIHAFTLHDYMVIVEYQIFMNRSDSLGLSVFFGQVRLEKWRVSHIIKMP